jgi:Xaa-Pro aminopeptidase
VAAGPNGARPHHRSGSTPIEAGMPIVIDMGASVGGYCADLTRTTWIGEIPDDVRSVYAVVERAQHAALAAVRAGTPASTVDRATREVFEAAGMTEGVVHAVGHGLGIRVHDGPSVSIASNVPLEAGNVVTIEPGLYFPGRFGVRIEDVVVVEADSCRVLSHARKHAFADR